MDFRNLCQKIDVDSIKAKLPTMPAMPQIKLPKSIPKLKSRKIFRSSREDVNKTVSPKHLPAPQQLAPPIQSADFINRTPTRISTISSLMHEGSLRNQQSTYRSACSIEDDYPSPTQYKRRSGGTGPISPVRRPADRLDTPDITGSRNEVKMSLTEKLQKGYKDFSEFRFKHIFTKKTVVRKDIIRVNDYVQRYDEERLHEEEEEERRDREIAENYNFNFKVSRQNTEHSNSLSPNDSPEKIQVPSSKMDKSVSQQSGDESGMEDSPPKRKPGIASTRFAKMRNPPLKRSTSEDSNIDSNEEAGDEEQLSNPMPNSSELWSIKETCSTVNASPEAVKKPEVTEKKEKAYKERMRRLTSYVSSHDESGADSGAEGGASVLTKLRGLGKRNNEERDATTEKKRKPHLTPQQSEDQDEGKTSPATENTLSTIKLNLKRFQKSMKRQPASTTDESEDEETAAENKPTSKTEKLTARLRRFKSRDVFSTTVLDNETENKDEGGNKTPVRAAITNKLQSWKKSFKKKQPEASNPTDDEQDGSPDKPKRSDTLINKLKYIRSRKNPNSKEDLDVADDEDQSKTKDTTTMRKSSNLEEKFEQARQRTMKKVNEKMQQIKFSHKSQENIENENSKKNQDSDEDEPTVDRPPIARRPIHDRQDDDEDDIEEINNIQKDYVKHKAQAVWTTRPILSESTESDTDAEFPRVLIHQDNSNLYESTLIIAVTRPAPPSPSPKIIEIVEEKPPLKSVEWVPNREIISGFLEVTPPNRRKTSAEAIVMGVRGHARRLSMDSNSDSDSWIPENVRNKPLNGQSSEGSRHTSIAGLNSIVENEEPWKVHSIYPGEKLFKTKSIDIFENSVNQGGPGTVFEDFDDELKNEPVVKIAGDCNFDSFEKDSSEDPDPADDDNSSRVTKILVETIREESEEDLQHSQPLPNISKERRESQNLLRQIGNSRESLVANYDENEEMSFDDIEDDEDEVEEEDRPPSAAPSPPPTMSPPPPPLPRRKPSIRISKPMEMEPAPMSPISAIKSPLPECKPLLPHTKPPLPVNKPIVPPSKPPPQIPERTASMTRIAKPLVKTSSLRLAYNEQVKPGDVGKVNKLISRFEQPQSLDGLRIIRRRLVDHEKSDEYSEEDDDDDDDDSNDDEDTDEAYEKDYKNSNIKTERDMSSTPTNVPRTTNSNEPKTSIEANQVSPEKRVTSKTSTSIRQSEFVVPTLVTTTDEENNTETPTQNSGVKSPVKNIPQISVNLDRKNSNFSGPSSEYGSPLEYPSSLMGSTETTPIPDRKQDIRSRTGRSRRSMTRDDENFYSFDSDEEHSYYSISSTGSSRYVVEI